MIDAILVCVFNLREDASAGTKNSPSLRTLNQSFSLRKLSSLMSGAKFESVRPLNLNRGFIPSYIEDDLDDPYSEVVSNIQMFAAYFLLSASRTLWEQQMAASNLPPR